MGRSRVSAVVALLMGVVVGLGLSVSLDWAGQLAAAPKLSDEELEKELRDLSRGPRGSLGGGDASRAEAR